MVAILMAILDLLLGEAGAALAPPSVPCACWGGVSRPRPTGRTEGLLCSTGRPSVRRGARSGDRAPTGEVARPHTAANGGDLNGHISSPSRRGRRGARSF